MAGERSTAAPAPAAAERPRFVDVLDEDAQVEVLRAAKSARVLGALASSSKQLCSLARSRVPFWLYVSTAADAEIVIRSHACGRPPFSACTELTVEVCTLAGGLITVGVLNAAQHWAALRGMELLLRLSADQLEPNQTLDYCGSGVLSALPALRGLRSLELEVAEFGVCSARPLGQMAQLTRLKLCCTAKAAADAVPPDLAALSGMTSLLELELGAPSVKPAAGTLGPFCFPSGLTSLYIYDALEYEDASAACIARCLTHLPTSACMCSTRRTGSTWRS